MGPPPVARLAVHPRDHGDMSSAKRVVSFFDRGRALVFLLSVERDTRDGHSCYGAN